MICSRQSALRFALLAVAVDSVVREDAEALLNQMSFEDHAWFVPTVCKAVAALVTNGLLNASAFRRL